METILIKNGKIITADKEFFADILVKNGKIEKIAKKINFFATRIIDASGKYVIPGGIDPHVHFHLPFYAGYTADDFESGTTAALFGGTTTVIDFVTPLRGQNLTEAYLQRLEEAEKAACNVFFHVSPVDWHDGIENEIKELTQNYGIKSFKIYMAYKNAIGIEDKIILRVLEASKKYGFLVISHCENDEIINFLRDKFVSEGKTSPYYHALSRPPEAEAEAIERLILFAKYLQTPVYIVHVSTKLGIEKIAQAQKQGIKVYAETCPQYLLLNDKVYELPFLQSSKYVMSPPLRKIRDSEALWKHIKSGTVYTVGTDHCSFNIQDQKSLGKNDFRKIPNGAAGVQHRLSLLYTYGVLENKISMQKFVEITSGNPARIFGLDKKGDIKEGFDADIVIWNPDTEQIISSKTHKHKADNSIYEGFKIIGNPEIVILNGKIVVEQ